MKHLRFALPIIAFGLVAALVAPGGLHAQTTAPPSKLEVGDPAPDFTLPSTKGGEFRLSDYRGKKNVVLAFFFAAFTGG